MAIQINKDGGLPCLKESDKVRPKDQKLNLLYSGLFQGSVFGLCHTELTEGNLPEGLMLRDRKCC